MKMPRSLAAGLKYLLTLLLLFLVFQSVEISKIKNDIRSIHSGLLIILVALCWAGQLLCSERWRIFASALHIKGKYRTFFRIYFAGMFFNIGLPSLVGGDVIKAYVISRKSSQPLSTGLASVLQDRAAGLISLLVYGSIAMLLHPLYWKGFPLLIAYLLSWIGISVVLLLVFKGERLYRKFLNPESRSLLQISLKKIADFHQALGNSSLTRSQAIRVTLYSFFYSALVLWIFQQVTVAAGHGVGVIEFSALFPLITLGTMVPITLGGLGTREWLYVEALSLAGVPRDHGLIISLTTSVLYLVVNLGGIAFLPAIPLELRPQALDFSNNAAQPDTAEHRIPQRNDVI